MPDIPYPVVDLFAGPGGLGEGFALVRGERCRPRFENVLSVENEPYAHQTLLLRHFLRQFSGGELPEDYYRYLRSEIPRDELYRLHPNEIGRAEERVPRICLGSETRSELHQRIRRLLEKRGGRWVLVGGPPCQAFSLIGRSRMNNHSNIEGDSRHRLYREYLSIIIEHMPPVFVMENVKGLLSAKAGGTPIIDRIVSESPTSNRNIDPRWLPPPERAGPLWL